MWLLTDENIKSIKFNLKILRKKCEQWQDGTLHNAVDRIEKEFDSRKKVEVEHGRPIV
jgi:hypothetical protein